MDFLLTAAAIGYLTGGLGTAALVLLGFAARFDPAARGASLGFRLAVLPGTVLLWPLVLRALVRGDAPTDRTAHDDASRGADA